MCQRKINLKGDKMKTPLFSPVSGPIQATVEEITLKSHSGSSLKGVFFTTHIQVKTPAVSSAEYTQAGCELWLSVGQEWPGESVCVGALSR